MKIVKLAALFVVLFGCLTAPGAASAAPLPAARIVCPADAPRLVRLAASEIRRYVYLRTGELLPIVAAPTGGGAIALSIDPSRESQEYRLQTRGQTLTISGGSELAVLYGAYDFAEKLGVRFYLHGDVLPDERIPLAIPQFDEMHKPLFALRGVNPWGSHPFGFDAWSADDYKAIFAQLAKMRMNFLGVHCYPEGLPYAEATVWHGLAGDCDAQGRVKSSCAARYFNTLLTPAWGDFLAKKTGDYSFGAALLFDRDDWAPPAMVGHCPLPATPAACNEVFNRMGAQLRDAFAFARRLGVKTCVGTESPLTIPAAVRQRLLAQGKSAADAAAVRAVYEGTFRRIAASHPLDYYWLWTPERWTWGGNSRAEYDATVSDIKLAYETLKNVHAPFKLAACGWVLGPAHDRAAFAAAIPKEIPLSAISQNLGHSEVEPALARIAGREKWAIPWLESDAFQGLAGIQLYAGRVRRDAADAAEYGCTGLMGLHWRTDVLSPNIAALAQAAWDQSWKPASSAHKPRCLPCKDFYTDWARANFGLAAADDIATVFAEIDGKVPLATADGCPVGPLTPDATPWSEVRRRFAFVDDLAKLRAGVRGVGSRERFDYWLNMFNYYRALAELRCAMAKPQPAEIARLFGDAYRCLLATVNTPGGLAMVVAMESHPGWGPRVASQAAQPWPKQYQGLPRIVVPTVRGSLEPGETLSLKVMILAAAPASEASLFWRELGRGEFRKLPLTHAARGVYTATFPPGGAQSDIEYYLEATCGETLHYPATAPTMNQTLVLLP